MNILDNLNLNFKLIVGPKYQSEAGDLKALSQLSEFKIPEDYILLTNDYIAKEFHLKDNRHFQLWSISDVMNLYEDYNFKEYFPNCIPIGDNGGGYLYIYFNGNNDFGIYHVPFSPLDEDYAVFISQSLTSLLIYGEGIENLIL